MKKATVISYLVIVILFLFVGIANALNFQPNEILLEKDGFAYRSPSLHETELKLYMKTDGGPEWRNFVWHGFETGAIKGYKAGETVSLVAGSYKDGGNNVYTIRAFGRPKCMVKVRLWGDLYWVDIRDLNIEDWPIN